MMPIGVLDYGLGNLKSIQNMLHKLSLPSGLVTRASEFTDYRGLILPGVGHFDHGMKELRRMGMAGPLKNYVNEGRGTVLGICLGMQLLMESSEEGVEEGLALIPGHCRGFSPESVNRVPHMGWNYVVPSPGTSLWSGLSEPKFYFVHSYYVVPADDAVIEGRTTHGMNFASVIRNDNLLGAQFHPEKSHQYGMKFLMNVFAEERQ